LSSNCRSSPPNLLPSPLPGEMSAPTHLATDHSPLVSESPPAPRSPPASHTSTPPDLRSTGGSYVATPRHMPAYPIVLAALAHLIPSWLRSSLPCRYSPRRPAIIALLALAAHRPPIFTTLTVYYSLFPIGAAAAMATPPPLLLALCYWCGYCGAKSFIYSALPPQQAFIHSFSIRPSYIHSCSSHQASNIM
jgi:hypothetical protein